MYNSRDEVDSGLSDLAPRGPKALAAYDEIKKQYAVAERALPTYFRKTFQLDLQKAKKWPLIAGYRHAIALFLFEW